MATRRETIAGLVAVGAMTDMGMARAAGGGKAFGTVRRNIGPIMQHGYVVKDAENEARRWAEKLGVGPFYISESDVENYVYHGRPVKLRLKVAFSYWDGDQIELIQQISAEESLYSPAIRTAPGKLNHVAIRVADIDAAIRDLGAEQRVGHRGGGKDMEFAYLENYMPDSSHLEFLRVAPHILASFDGVTAICRAWDGARPVRAIQDLMSDLGSLQKPAASGDWR
jgi:hypothetical protein